MSDELIVMLLTGGGSRKREWLWNRSDRLVLSFARFINHGPNASTFKKDFYRRYVRILKANNVLPARDPESVCHACAFYFKRTHKIIIMAVSGGIT